MFQKQNEDQFGRDEVKRVKKKKNVEKSSIQYVLRSRG